MKRIISIAFLLALMSPAFPQGHAGQKQPEPLQGFRLEKDRMVFTVFNHGYTEKSSFRLDIRKKGRISEIELVRIRGDYGKMVPQPEEIVFTTEELKGRIDLRQPVQLKNPFVPDGW